MHQKLSLAIIMLLCLVGCAPNTYYSWNGYDEKLHNYYKTPAESDQFISALYEIISAAGPDERIPPGIYAEYGYQLLERGQFDNAVIWFNKEKDTWSESDFFMNKMIYIAKNRQNLKNTKMDIVKPTDSAAETKVSLP